MCHQCLEEENRTWSDRSNVLCEWRRETSSLKLAKLRGCTFVNQYVVIKYLGRGACGRVFLCMDMTDNRLYAVKVMRSASLTCLCAWSSRTHMNKQPDCFWVHHQHSLLLDCCYQDCFRLFQPGRATCCHGKYRVGVL